MQAKKIKTALISVFYKDKLEQIVRILQQQQVTIYSTGGTQKFIESLNIPVVAVEDLTGYPSILGGRVKTLHPKVFGGILARREKSEDEAQLTQYEIPPMDLVIVDLYPFEEALKAEASEEEMIEKIDIGGISLIRAAAKNFQEVAVVASRHQYELLTEILQKNEGSTTLAERKQLATLAFATSSHYDATIFDYFNKQTQASDAFKVSIPQAQTLRYGENPHQKGVFYGHLTEMFEQLNGKALSYNNLVDVDAAVGMLEDLQSTESVFIIIKHTNACGVAIAATPKEAYLNALKADPVSAFGGIIITNQPIDKAVAEELHQLFFEVLIAPSFEEDAFTILKAKKNRILLKQHPQKLPKAQYKTLLNGVVWQEKDTQVAQQADFTFVTEKQPTTTEQSALVFAAKIAKHAKSNTIVLAKENQLLASGVGQTSRVDALKQAIVKAKNFGFDLQGAVMASDAFFPFPDCVEIAQTEGITAVIQPGGSIRDQDSIDFCNQHQMAMVFTGVRHFRH
ncbi:MAG: bifunctional phosphoribosylaminoimidazolecarboxamide formyltransferase/IMP cyclohydrolase [Thermonemataceae bacterium]